MHASKYSKLRQPIFIFLSLSIFTHLAFSQAYSADQSSSKLSVNYPVKLDFIWVPAGSFLLGDQSGKGQADEKPVRNIRLDGFWIQTTEVTRASYEQFVKETQYETGNSCWIHQDGWIEQTGLDWDNPGFPQGATHPVTCVSWYDAKAFITWLNQQSSHRFRLPSESEWEYAVRAGSNSTYFFGNDPIELCEFANAADLSALADYPDFSVNQCNDNYVRTSPVGIFKPNPLGLYDVYGNVWEWVEDCWTDNYRNHPDDGKANKAGDCSKRGFRGGGYGDIPHFARSTLRNRGVAEHRKDDIGFRLVLE